MKEHEMEINKRVKAAVIGTVVTVGLIGTAGAAMAASTPSQPDSPLAAVDSATTNLNDGALSTPAEGNDAMENESAAEGPDLDGVESNIEVQDGNEGPEAADAEEGQDSSDSPDQGPDMDPTQPGHQDAEMPGTK